MNDKASALLGGVCHARPNRPRPFVCSSASTSVPWGASRFAQPRAASLVDPSEAYQWRGCPREDPEAAIAWSTHEGTTCASSADGGSWAMTVARRIALLRSAQCAVCLLFWVVLSPVAAQETAASASSEVYRAVVALETAGSVFEAKVRLDNALLRSPSDAQARVARARVLLRMGRPMEALSDARIATAAIPGDGVAWLTRMEAARLSGRVNEALRSGDQAAALALTSAPLHVRLAWNARLLGNGKQAEAFARIAVQQDPHYAPAYAELARVFDRQGLEDAGASVVVRGIASGVLAREAFVPEGALARWADHPEVRRALR